MKEKINIKNYEAFFIDYLEGELTEKEIVDLEEFLLQNPELKDELEGLEKTVITPEKITYPFSENLLQIDLTAPVSDDNFEFFCIAQMEGDLSDQQTAELNSYVNKNPGKQKIRKEIQKIRISSNSEIIFPEKTKLKKHVFTFYRKEITTMAAVAAGITLLISFWWTFIDRGPELNKMALNETNTEKERTELADSTSITTQKEENTQKRKNQGLKSLEESAKKAVKKATTKISFKTGIPVASIVNQNDQINTEPENPIQKEVFLKNVSIDAGMLSNLTPISPVQNDPLQPSVKYVVQPVKKYDDPSEYLSLQEFAVKKLSDIVFREDRRELNAINLAAAGIDKINNVAGTNMKLEASAKENSNKKMLSFDSKLISFSTPINRED